MLHAHPAVALAGDGAFPFFKFLRNALAAKLGLGHSFDFDEPLHDYYFDRRRLFTGIQEADLEVAIDAEELARLRALMQRWCTDNDQYAPWLAPHLDQLGGETYGQVLAGLWPLVVRAYGGPDTAVAGIKEVWTGEFVPALLRSDDQLKVIYLTRDPRGVAASKKHRAEKYPWLFMGRQWRKLAALGWLYGRGASPARARTLALRFEDLITDPVGATEDICRFLELDWHPAMVDPAGFVNGRGRPWRQNTAYQARGAAGFDPATCRRWRGALARREIELIEFLCAPEMLLWDYELTGDWPPAAGADLILDPPAVPADELAGWITRTMDCSAAYTAEALARERLRYDLLDRGRGLELDRLGPLIERAFLTREVFKALLETAEGRGPGATPTREGDRRER